MLKGKAENWLISRSMKYNTTGLGADFPPLVPAGTGGANHGEFADLQSTAPARERRNLDLLRQHHLGKLSLLFLALGSRMPPSGVRCSLSTLPF